MKQRTKNLLFSIVSLCVCTDVSMASGTEPQTMFQVPDCNQNTTPAIAGSAAPGIASEAPLSSEVSRQYLAIPEIYWKKASAEKEPPKYDLGKSLAKLDGFSGLIEESPNRVTYFVEVGKPPERVMVTKWRFKDEGATICVPDALINTQVQGNPATIAIARAKSSENIASCLWKVDAIVEKRTQYEFWLSENCSGKNPGRTYRSIINLIQENMQLSP